MERGIKPLRATARVLLWMSGLLAGVAAAQDAAMPLGVAFLASMASLHVLRVVE